MREKPGNRGLIKKGERVQDENGRIYIALTDEQPDGTIQLTNENGIGHYGHNALVLKPAPKNS
jgi:hypothetical protein